MTDPNFSRPGAVDLANLASSQKSSASGSYVTEIDHAGFQRLANQSMQFPVIIEFYSARDTGSAATSAALAEAVNAGGGRYLLGRVNVDAQQDIAQSLGVQAVPTVVAILSGQLAPLFQGTKDKTEIQALLDQVAQIAVANGMTGRAQPVSDAVASDSAEPAVDPRFEPADEALAAGDYQRAVEEFDKLLTDNPSDAEAIAGRAQALLLARSVDFEPEAILAKADAAPQDIDAQLDYADLAVIRGEAAAAFDALLNAAESASAEDKERVRVRLLELFEVVGRSDQAVLKARRRLSTLLF